MLDLGPHASFIIAAYGVTFIAVAALVLATYGDDLKQRRLLAALERRGIKRRSAEKPEKPAPKTAETSPPLAKKSATRKTGAKRKTARKTPKPRARKTPS